MAKKGLDTKTKVFITMIPIIGLFIIASVLLLVFSESLGIPKPLGWLFLGFSVLMTFLIVMELIKRNFDRKNQRMKMNQYKQFWGRVEFPKEFDDYLSKESYGKFAASVELLKESNFDLIAAGDGRFARFNNVVFFASDGGRCFFLDFRSTPAKPSVKYLELATNIVKSVSEEFNEDLLKKYLYLDETIRVIIDVEDEQYEEKTKELEIHTMSFLDRVVFPDGFEKYLSHGKDCIAKSVEELKNKNIELIIHTNDYFTQFRNVVFFAADDYGHGWFFLDYGKNSVCPSVKHLDDETDEIVLVSDVFNETCLD